MKCVTLSNDMFSYGWGSGFKIDGDRLIRGQHDDNVITKFINESYHIENEYVMQLNPRKFDSVPEYVVQECDRLLGLEDAA